MIGRVLARLSIRFWLLVVLYGVIQAYLADDAVRAFSLSETSWLPAVVWALFMTWSPMLLWRLEQQQAYRVSAMIFSWFVFGWMGFSFLCFWLAVATDLYGWTASLAGLSAPDPRQSFSAVLALTTALWLYGFYAARHPRVERVTIRSDMLPAGFPGLRIVQISDVHLGIMVGRRRLRRLLQRVTDLEPDILVSTGDLVDGQAHYLDGLSSLFAACRPRYGKVAVTG
ncbi:MAG TPA: metallophosphoesterase, partial [Mariprofundaceae bacterium]|nr:metallophosphoesterase [Mariprofundaceae bacterium]